MDLAEGRLRSLDRLWRNSGVTTFFPCRLRRHSSRKTRKFLLCCRAPAGCAVDRLRPVDHHRGRKVRARKTEIKENYHGDHRHLQEVRQQRVQRRNRHPLAPGQERPDRPRDQPLGRQRPPSHRIYVGRVEIGAAWSKRSNEGRDYLGLKLDDPSFTAPIFANLFADEEGEGFSLIWSRPSRRNGD
ncbi:uncharacterized protein (DUF736 family) [Bradyrhizobium elkanii]